MGRQVSPTYQGRASRRDLRRVYELVEECRGLGDDADSWRVCAMERLMDLLPAQVAIGNEIADLRDLAEKGWEGVPPGAPARSARTGPIRLGFAGKAERHAWETYADETPVRRTPYRRSWGISSSPS